MFFVNTRGGERVSGAQAIVQGISANGGLFVPEQFPAVSTEEIEALCAMDYSERVAFILGKFFEEYPQEEVLEAVREAYAQFEGGDAAPLVRMDNGMYMLELFHGPTCTFKDLALTVLPYLLQKGCEICGTQGKELLLIATGGDTGKAALEGFREKTGVKLIVFYPEEGVSKMQKLQLCTTEGGNVNVVAVRGSFDDCQTGMKRLMHSEKCKALLQEKNYLLTSANSVNFAIIAAQIAYYFSAYCDLLGSEQIKSGDVVDFAVPTGNFGNILCGYYAKLMGLPVGTLVCASNKNNALTEFFKSGMYDGKRSVHKTMSSSMDILLPSNLERLLFELSGRDGALTADRMKTLSLSGRYSITADELKKASAFYADFTGEDDTVECMYDFFMEYGYPMDTHTGVAMSVAQRYTEKIEEDPKAEKHPMVVISTASPYTFPQDVLYALTGNDVKDSFKGVKRIHLLTAMKVPESLKAIRYKPLLHKTVIGADKMFDEVSKFLG